MAKIAFFYFDLHTGYYPSFHHGLASLIGTLKSAHHSVRMTHLTDEREYDGAIASLKEENPDIIALSFTTNQKKHVRQFLEKAGISSKFIIAGGVHPTLVKEQLFQDFPEISGTCIGEGEIPLTELCARIDRGEPYLSTPSFYFRTASGIVKNQIAPLMEMDAFALPDYTLFNYRRVIKDAGDTFSMMLSRGCPYTCHYCCNHIIKEAYPNKANYVRFPSIRRSINIIKNNLMLYPETKKITFADDTFTLNKKWLAEFCKTFKEEIGLPFFCNARVETITDDVVRTLKDADCVSIDFGVESGNEWLRANILNRKHSNKKLKEAFAITRRHGIKTFSFNIVGLPFETREMAMETLHLNMELRPNFGQVFFFYPYPGSKLFQLCLDYGFLPDDLESASGYLEGPTVKEIFMSHKEMRKIAELMQAFFYARLIFSKLRMPLSIEKALIRAMLVFRKPIIIILDPLTTNPFLLSLRRAMRKVAMRFLR